MGKDDFIPKTKGAPLNFLSAAFLGKLQGLLERPEMVLDGTQFEMVDRGGKKFWRLRTQGKGEVSRKRDARDRFQVWLDEARQKLMVDPGSVVYQGDTDGTVQTPIFPTLEGTAVDVVDSDGFGQGFPLTGKSTGVLYTVILRYKAECGSYVPGPGEGAIEEKLELLSPGEVGGIDLMEGEAAVIVAEVTFTTGDLGKAVDGQVRQLLGSDWYPSCGDMGGGSSSSGSSGFSSSSSGSSGGSSAPSYSSSDDDPDPPGGTACCDLIITSFSGISATTEDGFGCFANGEEDPVALVSVTVEVEMPVEPDCLDICDNWSLKVTIPNGVPVTLGSNYTSLDASGSGSVSCTFRVHPAFPCGEMTLTALVAPFGGQGFSGDPVKCALVQCKETAQVTMPPYCGDECETTVIGTTII